MPTKPSRQRNWQKKHTEAGLCSLCSEPLATSTYCLKHAARNRERKRKPGMRVYANCLTRKLVRKAGA